MLAAVPIVFLLISNENGSLCGFFRGRKGRMAPHTAKHHQENVSSLLPFCASRLTGWKRGEEGIWGELLYMQWKWEVHWCTSGQCAMDLSYKMYYPCTTLSLIGQIDLYIMVLHGSFNRRPKPFQPSVQSNAYCLAKWIDLTGRRNV